MATIIESPLFSDVYDDEVSTVLSSDRFEPVVGQNLAKVHVYACRINFHLIPKFCQLHFMLC